MNAPNVIFKLFYIENEKSLESKPKLKQKYGELRKFYACQKDFNHVSYVNDGSKVSIDYISYSGNREKSAGVFDEQGLMDKTRMRELREKLRQTESVIWYGLISFEESFGKRYVPGFDEAYSLMKSEFPKFLKSAGFKPENVEWFAGLHTNTENHHIHFSFFEKNPCRYTQSKQYAKSGNLRFSDGAVRPEKLDKFKISAEQYLTNISAEIKLARKELTEGFYPLLFSKNSKLKYQKALYDQMTNLIGKMPSGGRISYDSEQMAHLRPLIRQIVNLLIKSDKKLYQNFEQFCAAVQKKDRLTLQMLEEHKIDPARRAAYLSSEKVLNDFYRRLGNQIINSARIFKKKEKIYPSRRINKRIRKRTTAEVVAYCLSLNASVEQEANALFLDYLRKLDDEKPDKEFLSEME